MFQNKQQSQKNLIIKVFVIISNIRDWNLSSIVDYTVYPKDKAMSKISESCSVTFVDWKVIAGKHIKNI